VNVEEVARHWWVLGLNTRATPSRGEWLLNGLATPKNLTRHSQWGTTG
jgi:hypothetical protein